MGDQEVLIVDKVKDDTYFTRKLKNITLHIKNESLLFSVSERQLHVLTSLVTHNSYERDIVYTLDVECLLIDNEFIPYTVGLYDGKNFHCEYGLDCIDKIIVYIKGLKRGMNVYVHN